MGIRRGVALVVTVQTMRRRVATGLVRRVHRRVLGRGGLGGRADLAQYRQGYAHHHQEGEQARQRAICPKRRNHAIGCVTSNTFPIHFAVPQFHVNRSFSNPVAGYRQPFFT